MQSTQRAWIVVVPIATLGIVVGHELAYGITRTPTGELHGYLVHAPQVALVITVLSFLAASFVTRGTRLALWPFPAVAVAGFIVQEHLEQLQHGGSLPLLLDRPVFLVGILLQCVVALVAWAVARLLLRVLHAQTLQKRVMDLCSCLDLRRESALETGYIFHGSRPRAPPATG